MLFIENLTRKYTGVYGHKKAIAELVGVSTNRISEWQRIWTLAQVSNSAAVLKVLAEKDVSLAELVEAIREEEASSTTKHSANYRARKCLPMNLKNCRNATRFVGLSNPNSPTTKSTIRSSGTSSGYSSSPSTSNRSQLQSPPSPLQIGFDPLSNIFDGEDSSSSSGSAKSSNTDSATAARVHDREFDCILQQHFWMNDDVCLVQLDSSFQHEASHPPHKSCVADAAVPEETFISAPKTPTAWGALHTHNV